MDGKRDKSPHFDSTSPSTKIKRKRRKIIKSCAFCRKRKLRCDQKKPMCSTCSARNFSECLYIDGNEYASDGKEFFGVSPESKLMENLNELEKQLDHKAKNGNHHDRTTPRNDIRPCESTNNIIGSATYNVAATGRMIAAPDNILNDFYTLECKASGRRIYYGPTSVKTFMSKCNWGLLLRFRQAWARVKLTRNAWKKKHQFSMLGELAVVEEPLHFNDEISSTLLMEICQELPSFEFIRAEIENFFADNLLHQINDILDKNKVLKDLNQGFLVGNASLSNGEKQVIGLCPSEKKNYYKIGVIIMILVLTHYRETPPAAIEKFFIYLTGSSTAKTMYIERAQFLLLRYQYRLRFAHTGGDNSHLMLLVDNLVSTALYLGLSHDIRSLYFGQEDAVGNIETLEKLWYWILFADVDIALNLGRAPRVTASDYDDDEMLTDHSLTFYGLLKRFLKISRCMLVDIYNRRSTPDLKKHCDSMIDFIEKEFPPIDLYTDKNLINENCLPNTRILCQALSLLITFYGLRKVAVQEMDIGLKNGAIKGMLISFSLCVNLAIFCYDLDRKKFPEMLEVEHRGMTPFLTLSISHINSLLLRALGMFYGFAYTEMTFFESGLLLVREPNETDKCDLTELRDHEGQVISFVTCFRMAGKFLDGISNSKDPVLIRVLGRSHAFAITIGMDRILRAVMEKVVECRANAETSWLSIAKHHQCPDMDARSLEKPESLLKTNVQPRVDVDNGRTAQAILDPGHDTAVEPKAIPEDNSNAGYDVLQNDNSTINSADPIANVGPVINSDTAEANWQSQAESEMGHLIAEEFGKNFNVGWEQLLNSNDTENFFSDIMM